MNDMQAAPRGGAMERMAGFLASGQFAAGVIALLLGLFAVTLLMLLWPAGSEGMGALALQFRMWCFGLDPATGRMEWMYVVMMLADPLVLAAIVAGLWWRPLRELFAASRRPLFPYLCAGVSVAVLGLGLLAYLGRPQAEAVPAFPADAIRLRQAMPAFTLTDHRGRALALSELRGKPVLVTSVYAHCFTMCPVILTEIRQALDVLPRAMREEVRVLAISMDPERDTPARLQEMARRFEMDRPNVHLLTGDPKVVHPLLDRLGIERKRDDRSGEIDHVSLFLLLDRRGELAYRLALGGPQKAWLPEALRVLAAEAVPST